VIIYKFYKRSGKCSRHNMGIHGARPDGLTDSRTNNVMRELVIFVLVSKAAYKYVYYVELLTEQGSQRLAPQGSQSDLPQ
jgi:hypothetical protein